MFEIILFVAVAVVAWFYMKSRHKDIADTSEDNAAVAESMAVSVDDNPVEKAVVVTETKLMALLYAQTVNGIPQDSTLRRHYLQSVMANKSDEVADFPEDSTLRRHYLQNESVQVSITEDSLIEVVGDEPVITEEVVANAVSNMPEEALLKRHFIQQVVVEEEETMSVRPTDSALKRHYDAQLLSAVIRKLQG